MALSPSEKQKRYRDRQKQAHKEAPDSTVPFLKRPFFEYLEENGNWSSVELAFDMMGIEPPAIDDDSDPRSFHGEVEASGREWGGSPYDGKKGSIARAELMVVLLLDAATELASIINNYKASEIDARIVEIERADLSEPTVKKKALADIVTLSQIRARLDRGFRRSFREINVKGTPSD